MTTNLNKINDCKRELEIIIANEEFQATYNVLLKKVQKNLKMPGFRPGKIPANIVAKQYGSSIKNEAIEEIANESLKKLIEKNEVEIVGTPAIVEFKEDNDNSQKIKVEFEVIPDFELKNYQSIEIEEPVHRVTDEEVGKEIDFIARKLGKREEIDVVTDGNCVVTADSITVAKNSEKVQKNENVELDLADSNYKDIKDFLLNAKVGDEIELSYKSEPDANPEKLIVKKIEKIIPCEQNDEFASLASNKKFDNFEDFQQEVGFQMQKQWDDRAKYLMEEQVVAKVVELHNDFSLPTVLVEHAKKMLTDELVAKNPEALNSQGIVDYINKQANQLIRTEIVRDKIIKKENIELEDFDYENFANDFLMQYPGMETAAAKDVIMTQLKADKQFEGRLIQKKFVDLLMDFAKTNEIDFDEYYKLHKNQ